MSAFKTVVVVICAGLVWCSAGSADITSSGDVSPANPATWTSGTDGTVGYSGIGGVNVDGGSGLLSAMAFLGREATGQGTVTVDGVGSSWTAGNGQYVGLYGNGTLDVLGGGQVNGTWAYLAYQSDSSGAITVDDANAAWTGLLTIGNYGAGTLTVRNGGQASNTTFAELGHYVGSIGAVTVDGAGSRWTNTGYLQVGYRGAGTVDITNGGRVGNADAYVPYATGSSTETGSGEITVDGLGSTWTSSANVYIGGHDWRSGGTGVLTVRNDGAVNVAGTLKIWAPGTVHLAGGTLTAANVNSIDGGLFDMTGGTLKANTFASTAANALTNAGGTVSPGTSIGTLTVNTHYVETSPAASVHIEIGGTGQGSQYDLLDVVGDATLMGGLIVELVDGFVPNNSDTFTILAARTIISEWANTSTVSVLGGGQFDVTYIYDDGIGVDDTVVLSSYVPEPTALALLASGGVVLIRRRRAK